MAHAHQASDPEGAPDDQDVPLRSGFFRSPWVATFLIAWTVGAIDGSTWERFQVFTSNQAGNLVLVGTTVFTDPADTALPAASLAGAAAGVILGTGIGVRFPRDAPMRTLAPMILATVLMVITVVIDLAGVPLIVLIPSVSASLACLASALIFLPSMAVWFTANTGQFLSAVQGLAGPRTAPGFIRGIPFGARRAAMMTFGFLVGAMCAGIPVITQHAVIFGLIPTLFVIAMGFREYLQRTRTPAT